MNTHQSSSSLNCTLALSSIFSKLFAISTLAILAAANPVAAGGGDSGPQCCESVQKASDPAVAATLKSIGVVVQDANVPVGLTCSPITVIGVGSGNACSSNVVCCQNNNVVSPRVRAHPTFAELMCVRRAASSLLAAFRLFSERRVCSKACGGCVPLLCTWCGIVLVGL